MAVTMIGAGILDASLKQAFHRVRPPVFFGIAPTNYSFPSGHALASFCFYSVLAGLIATSGKIHAPAGCGGSHGGIDDRRDRAFTDLSGSALPE